MRSAVLAALLVVGCGQVSFLPRVEDARYAPTDRVELLSREPTRPYVDLGLITVESKHWSEETMVTELRKRAKAVGAEAVVMDHQTTRADGATGVYVGAGIATSTVTNTRRLEGLAIRWDDAAAARAVPSRSGSAAASSAP
jgi:hypothetical protein